MTETEENIKTSLQHPKDQEYGQPWKKLDLSLSDDPTNPLELYYRGCSRICDNKFDLAVRDFNLAILSSKLPTDFEVQALYKRGFAYQKLSQFSLALKNYKQFLSRANIDDKKDYIHKAYFSIGTVYAALNQHEQAVRNFDDAIQNSGNNKNTYKLYYLHRARSRAFCGDFKKAQTDLDTVIKESTHAFFRGCAYNELGQHDKALEEYNSCHESLSKTDNKSKLLSVEILDDHVRLRRGLSYASLNLHDHALADYQRVCDKSNRITSTTIADRIFFRKGMSNMALNDVHEALINFNKSISLNSAQSDVLYARAMLHFKLGRHDAAVYDHRQALELGGLNSTVPSIYRTFFYTHNYNKNNEDPRIPLQKQLLEAEAKLKYYEKSKIEPEEQHRRIVEEQHRQVAEYQQQLAPYMPNPRAAHRLAREHIEAALKSSTARKLYDSMTSAIHYSSAAQILCNEYPGGIASERIVNEFIDSTMQGIREMSNIFEEYALGNRWNDLFDVLNELQGISSTNLNNSFLLFRFSSINFELKTKADIIKKTSKKFEDSPQQHEFYTLLVIRLCNLFDATRAATTGIFQHALTGTLTTISYVPKLLGYLCDFLPVGGDVATKVLCGAEEALKKLDQTRIQSALTHVGCLDHREKLYEAADDIAEKLTQMYKLQIERFPATKSDTINKREENKASCCDRCSESCCGCFKKTKHWLLNERENSNMQSIVKYAFELLVHSLTELEVSKVNDIEDLNAFFIDAICHSFYRPKIYCRIVMTKIQPTNSSNDADHWNTYDFFRRPGIRFEKGDIIVDKCMDVKKFEHRKPSRKEARLLPEKNEEELKAMGLKKYNEN